uniref:G-protein coupled receptors family 1 profile domain-containing protein n=1 Tax=Callorhinchus milii TaxID=7868 RepID=A0A4W3IWP8_CALMI
LLKITHVFLFIIIPGWCLILLLGIAVNTLIIAIVYYKSSFIWASCFSPYIIIRFALRDFDPKTHNWCLMQYYFLNVYICIATFAVVFMAVDRYYVICYPFSYEIKVTYNQITKLLLAWAIAIVYPTFYMIPFLGQESLDHLKQLLSPGVHFYLHVRPSTVITHGIILIIFFCNASLLFITGSLQSKNTTEESVVTTLRLTSDFLYLNLTPTFNPIIYRLRNGDLQKEFLKVFKKKSG